MKFLDSLSFANQLETWLISWLTPLWMVGLGCLFGLLGLLVVWGLCAVLSRVPLLGELLESPHRNLIIACGAVIAFLAQWRVAVVWGSGLNFDTAVPMAVGALVISIGVIALMSRRAAQEVPLALSEGVLWPILVVCLVFAAAGIGGFLVVDTPSSMFHSLGQIATVGTRPLAPIAIKGPDGPIDESVDPDEQVVDVHLDQLEIRSLRVEADQRLVVSPMPDDANPGRPKIEVAADQPFEWTQTDDSSTLFETFPSNLIEKLYVRNFGAADTTLNITLISQPKHPEAITIPITAVSVMLVVLLYMVHRTAMPRLSAVALATTKSEINHPLFLGVLIIGTVAILIFQWIPYFTFGEDIKMLVDSSLTLILVMSILQAVWAASSSVSDEIEGRTALTVLSKPIGRRSFILGKFLGIAWSSVLLYIVLGAVLLVVVAYKPIYDAREGSADTPSWQQTHIEMVATVPGLVLALMETFVLTAISVAISTRLPVLPNLLICFSIYVLGNLAPQIGHSSLNELELVRFVGQLITTILPVLDTFNVGAAIAGGSHVPLSYLVFAGGYCFIFCLIAMLLSLILFEDRDLA